jgi:aminopeptidase N
MLAVYDDEGWNTAAPDIQGDLTYSDAGFYLARVTAPDDVVLVGSGAIIDQARDGGTQTLTFAAGPARDFYLAAGDFAVVSETVGETTINSYAPAELADGAALALDVAAAALAGASARLSPYPYRELDIVTTPTSALGIEYPGLIVGTLNMYDVAAETAAGVPYEAILESTTAHEVLHQWFYNLVGNDQLDEPWLDEAVVGYSTYRYFADRYGQDVGDNYFQTFLGRWDRVERAEIPIGMPVASYKDAEYGAIVYGRGPVFVRELEETMGREVFDAFLRDYVTRFRWEEGTTAEFRALAEAHCGCDLGSLFAEFVDK